MKPSAKAAFEAMIAAHVPNATAHEIVMKGCQDGTYDNDMEKGAASAAKADFIAKGLSEDTADAAVRDMIAKGALVDDIGADELIKGIDLEALEDAVWELQKGAGDPPDLFTLDFDAADYDDPMDRAGALAESFAQKADEVVKASHAGREDLIKGFEVLASGFRDVVEQFNATIAAQNAKYDDVTKGLAQVTESLGLPMAPRVPMGLHAVPHPGDTKPSGDLDAALAKSKRLEAKCNEELRKATEPGDKKRWATAISALASGMHPDTFETEFGIVAA